MAVDSHIVLIRSMLDDAVIRTLVPLACLTNMFVFPMVFVTKLKRPFLSSALLLAVVSCFK